MIFKIKSYEHSFLSKELKFNSKIFFLIKLFTIFINYRSYNSCFKIYSS